MAKFIVYNELLFGRQISDIEVTSGVNGSTLINKIYIYITATSQIYFKYPLTKTKVDFTSANVQASEDMNEIKQ